MTLIKAGDPFAPDPSAPDKAEALRVLEKMYRVDHMLKEIEKKFGTDAFYCVVDTFYNSMPVEMALRVERFRYLIRRIKKGEKN